ncbi:MAG: hypothetical protein ABSF23_14925 [Terracidiphilus sp.]|jgi:negative regulator of sigma E activity
MRNRRHSGAFSPLDPLRRRAGWVCLAACIAAAVLAGVPGLNRGHAQSSPPPAAESAAPKPVQPVAVTPPVQPQTETTAGDASRLQLANECAGLLKLATELKTEVDKSNADELSVTVVRRASEIEQLAHKVRSANGKNFGQR